MKEYNGRGGLFMWEEKVVDLLGWGEERLAAFLVLHGRSCMVVGGGGVAGGGEKKGRVRLVKEKLNLGKKMFCFANFAHWFLDIQAMKSKSIYKRWKRVPWIVKFDS